MVFFICGLPRPIEKRANFKCIRIAKFMNKCAAPFSRSFYVLFPSADGLIVRLLFSPALTSGREGERSCEMKRPEVFRMAPDRMGEGQGGTERAQTARWLIRKP